VGGIIRDGTTFTDPIPNLNPQPTPSPSPLYLLVDVTIINWKGILPEDVGSICDCIGVMP
jgi:hypothetical protein